ncbi:MAG: hypothetical protein JRJ27_01255 [Deltaproteobacteria bacterium]|nr:hypothetical protein [Deltaproteobacteria bacterium]
MGRKSEIVILLFVMCCFLLAAGCGPKKAVGLREVFDTCALDATLDELGVLDDSVRNKEGYIEYVEEKLFEEKERNRYSKKVWKRLVKRTQRAAEQEWDKMYVQKKKLCVKHKGFLEKDEFE